MALQGLILWYNGVYVKTLFPDIEMIKICKSCQKEFNPKAYETCCSIKCRLFLGVKKEGDCWIWQGSTVAGNYGKVRISGITHSTHKASYLIFKGEIPDGLWVCHSCDVKKCINPDHLFLGSPAENRRDAYLKNRIKYCIGENNHFSRLSDIQAEEIRLLKSEGFTYERLSRIFNMSVTNLFKIVKNQLRRIK